MTEVELSVKSSLLDKGPLTFESEGIRITQRDDIETAVGPVHVCVQGTRGKSAIFTYHDIGMNSSICWDGYFSFSEMQPILSHFTVYHINAPGHEDGARTLPQSYEYPSMDQLSETLLPIMQYYGLRSFVGFGSGAGANILSRFALDHPEMVEGLLLLNCDSGVPGWSDWAQLKWFVWYLKSGQVTEGLQEYLQRHWFGHHTRCENPDLTAAFQGYIKRINPVNMGHFICSYNKRTDLELERTFDPTKKTSVRQFRSSVLMVTGDYSPHLKATIEMNTEVDAAIVQWMKFECGGMIHEEVPHKLTESFLLFLQGLGYVPTLRTPIHSPTTVTPVTPSCQYVEEQSKDSIDKVKRRNKALDSGDIEVKINPSAKVVSDTSTV